MLQYGLLEKVGSVDIYKTFTFPNLYTGVCVTPSMTTASAPGSGNDSMKSSYTIKEGIFTQFD